ncbi:hypothetical protein SLE2022_212670 [Rubroshorea leprosula]
MWCSAKKTASLRSLTILTDLLDSMDFNKDFQEGISNYLMVVKCQIFYRFWLSLIQVQSNTFLYIPSTKGGVTSKVDPAYVKWWNEEVFPSIFVVSIQILKTSKARNFIPPLTKSIVIRPQGKGKQL